MKGSIKFLGLLSLALMAKWASAEQSILCNDCSNPQAAIMPYAYNLAPGENITVNVLDIKKNEVNTFYAAAHFNRRTNSTIYAVFPRDTSSSVLNNFELLKEKVQDLTDLAYTQFDLSTIPSCTSGETSIDSAWDLYACPEAQRALTNMLYNDPTWLQQMANDLNMLSDLLHLTQFDIKIDLYVSLSDGSEIVFVFEYTMVGDTIKGMYKIDFTRSTDADGNILDPQQATGGASGYIALNNSNSGLSSLLAAAARAGILVDLNYPNAMRVSCVLNGNVLTCTGSR